MKNTGGVNATQILASPDVVQSVVLSSGVGQAFDAPAGAGFVAFAANADIWVRYGSTTAAVPTTSSTAATGSEFNPTIRNIGSTQTTTGISLVSETACKASLAWWRP